MRPALEALRDLVAQGCVDVVLVYSPDRLARKFAYQALLLEEFARAGVRAEFVRGPRGDSPEDQLLIQFQGMFAEYEKAQLMERYRRGKAHRARCGSVNVLGGAPFGYRYVPKTADSGASYEIVDHEAVIAAELFRRYTDDGASIADLTRWLTSENVPTRTGKARWDRSVVWGMLRNPAYAGTAVFGKTQVLQESPGLNRRARLEGRSVPRASKTVGRPREEWIEIPVPAIVTAETFGRAAQRLADNKRYAARNTKVPSLLQGLAACSACGYGYYRTSARTTSRKIYYYRCLGSDDYRYEGGRVCGNKPVRADYLDTVVWDHVTALLADPALIRAEITKRLEQARTADPATRQRKQLELALAKAGTGITAMIEAYAEQLITIDELRAKMPHLRARETSLRGQIDALDAQAADRDAYLKLADDLEGFLAQLRGNAATATVEERQRVLRLLVKDILIGPEKITIRHRIPTRTNSSAARQRDPGPDTEGDHSPGYPLRWGRDRCPLRRSLLHLRQLPVFDDPCGHPLADQPQDPFIRDPVPEKLLKPASVKRPEEVADIRVQHPAHLRSLNPGRQRVQRTMRAAARPEPVGEAQEIRLEHGIEHLHHSALDDLVLQRRHPQRAHPPVRFRYQHPPHRLGPVLPRLHPPVQILQVSPQVLLVLPPRQPVRARRRVPFQFREHLPQPFQRDVVQQRGEPRILLPYSNFPHTIQPT